MVAISPSARSICDGSPIDSAGQSVSLHANTFIAALYRGLLNRAPDKTGLESYTQALVTGKPPEEIVKSILRSREFQAWNSRLSVGVDRDLLNRHKAPERDLVLEPGCFTNWLGVRTDADVFKHGDRIRDLVFRDIPVVDDGVYGGYLEYASLLTAVEAVFDRDRFVAVELGAGWGPWITAIGVACRRLGFGHVILRGVEASEGRCELMRQHLARNGLLGQTGVECDVIWAAAWSDDTVLKFPAGDLRDGGAAASVEANALDYRGRQSRFVDTRALSLPTICRGLDVIDYMHWDLQGAELTVARAAGDFLDAHVRYLFVGTHSRALEGGMIEFFHQRGWDVLAERPCMFKYNRLVPTLEGMTTTDGEIFAYNPRLPPGGQAPR